MLALLDRLLDAAKDHPAEGEVTRVVAHTVPAAFSFLGVAVFQTVNDSPGEGVVGPRAGDKRVECHVLVLAFIHVEWMKVERGEDFDTVAIDHDETRTDE